MLHLVLALLSLKSVRSSTSDILQELSAAMLLMVTVNEALSAGPTLKQFAPTCISAVAFPTRAQFRGGLAVEESNEPAACNNQR